MTPEPGTILRPTGRGVLVAVLCAALWVLGDLARLTPARQLAAALLLMLILGGIGILVSSVGLRPRRYLVDDAVPLGGVVRVMLEMESTPWITVVPLGRAVVREHLPDALGGQGDLPLGERMPHVLRVGRRGRHALGAYSIIVRDLLGLFHLRRTVTDGLGVTGLPVIGELPPTAARAAGILRDGESAAGGASEIGEVGPIARPYTSGDDIRRVHWRASARTGRLMTREDEPSAGRTAVVVLDTSRRDGVTLEVEDALVSHAATVLDALSAHGWDVRVLDASGDEITRASRRRGRGAASPLGGAADAVEQRACLHALADVVFEDDASAAARQDPADGLTSLALALGPDDGEPFSGLELDRFAGRALQRTAIALRPAPAPRAPSEAGRPPGAGDGADFGHAHERRAAERAGMAAQQAPFRTTTGSWALVRGTAADTLPDLLLAEEGEER